MMKWIKRKLGLVSFAEEVAREYESKTPEEARKYLRRITYDEIRKMKIYSYTITNSYAVVRFSFRNKPSFTEATSVETFDPKIVEALATIAASRPHRELLDTIAYSIASRVGFPTEPRIARYKQYDVTGISICWVAPIRGADADKREGWWRYGKNETLSLSYE